MQKNTHCCVILIIFAEKKVMGKNYGVYFSKDDQKWVATLVDGDERVDLARFDTWNEAVGHWEAHRRQNNTDRMAASPAKAEAQLHANGVSWCKRSGKWRAIARQWGRTRSFGYFDTPQEARAAYEKEMGLAPGGGTVGEMVMSRTLGVKKDHKKSGERGVVWHDNVGKWMARSGSSYLGYYDTVDEAAKVVREYEWDGTLPPRPKRKKVVFEQAARHTVSASTPGVLHWDGKQGAWCIGGIPCSNQRAAYRRHKKEEEPWWKQDGGHKTARTAGVVTGITGAVLEKPKPGPYTVVERDNPDRQMKPHDKGGKRYSMEPGVSFSKKGQKWTAYCKKKHLGSFATEELAIEALNKAKQNG